MGEPAGIGGEIALAAWERLRRHGPPFALLDDPARIARLAAALGREVPVRTVASPAEAVGVFADALPVLDIGERIVTTPGRPSPATAGAVIGSIRRAVELVRAGAAPALVTNPIQKSALTAAGFGFPGHTEFLAHLAGVERPVMMLAGPDLRVVPITVHVPVSAVPGLLTHDLVVETARITHAALRDSFGIARPRLALAGLNPHAGEDGTMGREDIEIVAPAVAALRADGLAVRGPLPADTLFTPRARATYDCALCMYHDQALIPVKTLDMDGGVNVTLGLDIVRTSPDHGTALDIAGKGLADAGSLIAALRMAADMARHRAQGNAA
jgi:4-hydroxythreonine-4-phosphate dehydrogenase